MPDILFQCCHHHFRGKIKVDLNFELFLYCSRN
jgi:hypothetical protein